MSQNKDVKVIIKYDKLEAEFEGPLTEAFSFFTKTINGILPTYKLASQIFFTPDLKDLIDKISGFVVLTPDGPSINSNCNLTTEQAVILYLITSHVGFELKTFEKKSFSIDELCRLTDGKRKSVYNRLRELTEKRFVSRNEANEYQITSLGIKFFLDKTLPELTNQTAKDKVSAN
jgi:hypothetical protein